jgi:hypothetical protein
MQTTLRIDDTTYREAKAEAARCGVTLTRFLEEALREKIASSRGDHTKHPKLRAEVEERDRLLEALLERTAGFRVGAHPTRDEMNAR